MDGFIVIAESNLFGCYVLNGYSVCLSKETAMEEVKRFVEILKHHEPWRFIDSFNGSTVDGQRRITTTKIKIKN